VKWSFAGNIRWREFKQSEKLRFVASFPPESLAGSTFLEDFKNIYKSKILCGGTQAVNQWLVA